MSESRSVSSHVDVAADPATAFAAFTEEMDQWWLRGPINFYDASRAVAKRCEPGVGGRILEVYDDATGEVLEEARITVWEPGRRIAWQSSLDDVQTEIRFEATDAGTRVTVAAHIPAGGADRGGTAYVRVTPAWFGRWCARRDHSSATVSDRARLALAVYYANPAAAARWLAGTFGFEPVTRLPDDEGGDDWIEFHVANCSLMLFKGEGPEADRTSATHIPWVFVDDLDAHFAHAEASGARIVEPVHQHGYRGYVADDPEGHRWTFAQARPTMT